jgi:TRAP-type C4-dicarboxylate transport system substrate-binding protein
MKRVFSAVAAFAFGVMAVPESNAQTVLDLASGYPATSFHVQNLQAFAEDVAQRTGGQLQVRVHPGGSLAKAGEIRAAVAEGRIAMGEVFGPSLGALHPVFALDALPFLATNYESARRLWNMVRPLAEKRAGSQGLSVLMSVPWPPQGLFAAREIRTVGDFKGLAMRENSPPVKRLAEILGARPVLVESADLPAALSGNKVQLVFTSAAQGVDTRMWEHLPWFYQANAWLPRNLLLINARRLDSLPREQRDALLRASAAAEERGWQLSRENAGQSLAALRSAGMKVAVLDNGTRSRLDRAGSDLTASTMRGADPELLGVLSAYLAAPR